MMRILPGHPAPEISWTRNNGPVPSDAETSWSLGKATLRISSATTQHGGRYSLTASNAAGSASSSADVVVKSMLIIINNLHNISFFIISDQE